MALPRPMTAASDPTPDAPVPALARAAGSPAAAPVTSEHAGHRLASHFQPIYSLTHHRAVGHEALLRATSVATGAPVPPMELFAGVDGDDARVGLDRAAFLQHLAAYAGKDADEWLFLNVHPRSLVSPAGPGIREIADAAVFLCSDEARYIHGHTLNVDGGFLAAGLMFGSAKAPPAA